MNFRFKALGAKPNENDVVIEGYANYFAKDAYNERMDPTSVKLDRFKKNPILLFNHDMNYPIGRVVDVVPKEDGLYVKAAVSGVDHEKVSYVRELVKDGTLCTFSIRFADETVVEDPETGGKLIKDWELQELSIVSIPAQPDSTFSLSNYKSLKDLRMDILKAKGALVAGYVQEHLDKLIQDMGLDKPDVLEKIMQLSGLSEAELSDILAGNVTPVPDAFMSACVEVLGCDSEELATLNANDVENQKKAGEVDACVSEKVPKLVKEGYDQQQAVAIAYDMCKNPKKNVCEGECEGGVKELANENPILMLLQNQVEMLGALNVKMELLIKAVEASAGSKEQEPSVPAPAQEPDAAKKIEEMVQNYQKRIKALTE